MLNYWLVAPSIERSEDIPYGASFRTLQRPHSPKQGLHIAAEEIRLEGQQLRFTRSQCVKHGCL
jgi:hypothetical protein